MSGNWSLTLPLPVTNCTIYRLANSAGCLFLYHLCGSPRFFGCIPFPLFLSGFGVDFLDFASTTAFCWGVSLPAGSDKGYSPLTSAAFSRNCCTKKLFFSSTRKRAFPTLPSGRVSRQKSLVNEAVGGVDDPAARWSSTHKRALPTLPSGRVSQQNALVNEAVGGVDDPTARWFQQLKVSACWFRFKK
jgi:hypothetical protein